VGRGGRHTLAVPLAPRLAARIAERPWEAFLTDPTQLANGLGDLLDAVHPDGVAVTLPSLAGVAGHRDAALEATRRLRVSAGDGAVLIAVLPADLDDVKAFLDAGVDGIVLEDAADTADTDRARTIANMCRFHRVVAVAPVRVPLHAPTPSAGLVLTDGECPADTDVATVADWVATVRGGS
jgi:DNA-binding NarL/FixJ family response regulator